MLERGALFALQGTTVFFVAEVIGAVVCSQVSVEKYPTLTEWSVVLTWCIVGSLVILPVVALLLWFTYEVSCLIGTRFSRLTRGHLGADQKPKE